MEISLEGKRALVTGGNSGIGEAIALALADAGAKVAINYASHPEAAEQLVQMIKQKHGEAISIGADVSDPKSVGDLFGKIDAAWGGIDILINNAGIDGAHALAARGFSRFRRHARKFKRPVARRVKPFFRSSLPQAWPQSPPQHSKDSISSRKSTQNAPAISGACRFRSICA